MKSSLPQLRQVGNFKIPHHAREAWGASMQTGHHAIGLIASEKKAPDEMRDETQTPRYVTPPDAG
jgi:hypothetical protein